ncbi:MAG: dCTP deaminase [Methanobacteriota archaeon]
MCILADHEIRALLDSGALRIEPFDERQLTPNGYDLTVAEVLVPELGETPVRQGRAEVPGHTRFLVSTREVVHLGPGTAGQLWIRSSFARKGVLAAFGKVEAGFEGTLTIGCFNASRAPFLLPLGERFCQIAFETMHKEPQLLYEKRSGTYQGQRGVTLAKDPR